MLVPPTSTTCQDISFTDMSHNTFTTTSADIDLSAPEPTPRTPSSTSDIGDKMIEEIGKKSVDDILEMETQQNSKETWTKLNRTIRVQILHKYAETYGKTNGLSVKDVKQLKKYLSDALDAKKLSKVKDVVYNRTTGEVEDIPGLYFHPTNKLFTIRTNDRQSTLKSLTPRRFTEKNTSKN